MEQKKIVYTLGSLNTLQPSIIWNTQPAQLSLGHHPQPIPILKGSTLSNSSNNLQFYNQTKAFSQSLNFPRKAKFIHKPAKGKQIKNTQLKNQKQTVLYKYFKRRIFNHNKTLEKSESQNFQFIKIMDWVMQACENLHLSKDAFYKSLWMVQKIYKNQANQRFSSKLIQIQVASILSLAAKMQSNHVNYPDAISAVCGFKKCDIIQGEIFVMKNIDFKIPLFSVQTKIMQICLKWHQFMEANKNAVKIQIQKLLFGDSPRILQWSSVGKTNFMDLCCISDLLLLKLANKISIQNEGDLISALLKALFLFVNYRSKQFFPIKCSQKTYVVLIFQIFIKQQYGYSLQKFYGWLSELIKLREKLNLVEKINNCLNERRQSRPHKQDIEGNSNNTCASFNDVPLEQNEFWKQQYRSILLI